MPAYDNTDNLTEHPVPDAEDWDPHLSLTKDIPARRSCLDLISSC